MLPGFLLPADTDLPGDGVRIFRYGNPQGQRGYGGSAQGFSACEEER